MTGLPSSFAKDHLESVRDVVANGVLTARFSFNPLGERTIEGGASSVAIGFGALQWHDASERWLGTFRAYSASEGRWLSPDPLGFLGPDGPNLYSYVTNNAVRFLDPLGLQRVPPMSLTDPPPPPKGCWNIGSYYVCNPPPGPTICAVQPRKCTPYVDRVLYWSCLMIRIPAPTITYPGPGGIPGSLVQTGVSCAQTATACLEGGFPPSGPGPGDPPIWYQATKPPQPGRPPGRR